MEREAKLFFFQQWAILSNNRSLSLLLTSTTRLLQVCPHSVVVREYRSCSSDFSTHITDGGHSWLENPKTFSFFTMIDIIHPCCPHTILALIFHLKLKPNWWVFQISDDRYVCIIEDMWSERSGNAQKIFSRLNSHTGLCSSDFNPICIQHGHFSSLNFCKNNKVLFMCCLSAKYHTLRNIIPSGQ